MWLCEPVPENVGVSVGVNVGSLEDDGAAVTDKDCVGVTAAVVVPVPVPVDVAVSVSDGVAPDVPV